MNYILNVSIMKTRKENTYACMCKHIHTGIDRQTDGRTDRQTNGWTDRQTDKRMDRQTDRYTIVIF